MDIFLLCLLSHLAQNERVEADDIYHGEHPQHMECPARFTNPTENLHMQQCVQKQQETINK